MTKLSIAENIIKGEAYQRMLLKLDKDLHDSGKEELTQSVIDLFRGQSTDAVFNHRPAMRCVAAVAMTMDEGDCRNFRDYLLALIEEGTIDTQIIETLESPDYTDELYLSACTAEQFRRFLARMRGLNIDKLPPADYRKALARQRLSLG